MAGYPGFYRLSNRSIPKRLVFYFIHFDSFIVDSTPVSLGTNPRVGDVMRMSHLFFSEMDGVIARNCTQGDW